MTSATALADYMKSQFGNRPQPWQASEEDLDDPSIVIEGGEFDAASGVVPAPAHDSVVLPVDPQAPIVRARSRSIPPPLPPRQRKVAWHRRPAAWIGAGAVAAIAIALVAVATLGRTSRSGSRPKAEVGAAAPAPRTEPTAAPAPAPAPVSDTMAAAPAEAPAPAPTPAPASPKKTHHHAKAAAKPDPNKHWDPHALFPE